MNYNYIPESYNGEFFYDKALERICAQNIHRGKECTGRWIQIYIKYTSDFQQLIHVNPTMFNIKHPEKKYLFCNLNFVNRESRWNLFKGLYLIKDKYECAISFNNCMPDIAPKPATIKMTMEGIDLPYTNITPDSSIKKGDIVNHNHPFFYRENFRILSLSHINLYAETHALATYEDKFFGNDVYKNVQFTEKTLFSFISKTIPIGIMSADTYEYLENVMGFKLFNDLFNMEPLPRLTDIKLFNRYADSIIKNVPYFEETIALHKDEIDNRLNHNYELIKEIYEKKHN
jgi:hypothetical protein